MEAKEIMFIATINPEAKAQYPQMKPEQSGYTFSLEDLMRGKMAFPYPEHWTFELLPI